MKKHAGRVAVLCTLLLGAVLALISVEWPLPASANKFLQAQLAKQSITLQYRSATFDLLGNVRLAGIDGHYQGLLEFSARQVLLRPLLGGGFQLLFDKGELHTGFLQLPIPETIQFAGGLRQKNGRTTFRNLRLKANSLVMLVRGDYIPERKPSARKTPPPAAAVPAINADGQLSKAEKALAAFLASLCNDTTLWVGDVEMRPGGGILTLTGTTLKVEDYTAESPVLRVRYPLSGLFLSADTFGSKQGVFKGVSIVYSAEEGTLWRAVAQSATIENIQARAISASARWPIASLADKSAARDIEACAQLGPNAVVTVAEGTLSPLSARLYGRVPSSILEEFGLKLETQKPGNFSARLRDKTLFFNFTTGAGVFYDLDYSSLSTRGRLSAGQAQIDRFKISGPGGVAQGSLRYDFATKEAAYTLVGRIDPLALPWFGPSWNKAFEPMGNIQPIAALSLRVMPDTPVRATGIAGIGTPHRYGGMHLNRTFAAYHFDENSSSIKFRTFANDEEARGQLSFAPVFSGTLEGHLLPASLARAYLPEVPEVLKHLYFIKPPLVRAQFTPKGYQVSAQTTDAVRFYSLDFDGLKASVASNDGNLKVDPVEFGFSGGRGGLNAQIDAHGTGYGTIWVREANLGEWSLLGPLSEMFKFTTLKFNSLDGSFTLEPNTVKIDALNLWGNEHAAQARGAINTQEKTLDMTVHLRTLGGSRPALGILAPIVQPFASLMEARLTGPLEKPVWKIQLSSPFAK